MDGAGDASPAPFCCSFGLFLFEDGDGLFDDWGQLAEVVDEGDEAGVDPGVGGEVETVGGQGALGSGDEGLDVSDDRGEAFSRGFSAFRMVSTRRERPTISAIDAANHLAKSAILRPSF
jgi:hypothetical protein